MPILVRSVESPKARLRQIFSFRTLHKSGDRTIHKKSGGQQKVAFHTTQTNNNNNSNQSPNNTMTTLLDQSIPTSPSTIRTNWGYGVKGMVRTPTESYAPHHPEEKEEEEQAQQYWNLHIMLSSSSSSSVVENDQEQGVEISFAAMTTTIPTPAICPVAQDMIRHAQELGDEQSPMGPQQESIYQQALCLQETTTGFYSEGTCHIHRILGWHFYQRDNYSCALTHFLQSLKVSMELDYRGASNVNEDHDNDNRPPHAHVDSFLTLVIMDDIQDVVEDMQLSNDFVNRVLHSWDLQDEVTEQQGHWDSSPQDPDTIHSSLADADAEETILQQALALLPLELDLERASVYTRLAHVAIRRLEWEQAMTYYRQALMILPQWLTPDHPQIVRLIRETHLLDSHKRTPPIMTTTTDRRVMVESRKAFNKLLRSKLRFNRWSFLAAE